MTPIDDELEPGREEGSSPIRGETTYGRSAESGSSPIRAETTYGRTMGNRGGSGITRGVLMALGAVVALGGAATLIVKQNTKMDTAEPPGGHTYAIISNDDDQGVVKGAPAEPGMPSEELTNGGQNIGNPGGGAAPIVEQEAPSVKRVDDDTHGSREAMFTDAQQPLEQIQYPVAKRYINGQYRSDEAVPGLGRLRISISRPSELGRPFTGSLYCDDSTALSLSGPGQLYERDGKLVLILQLMPEMGGSTGRPTLFKGDVVPGEGDTAKSITGWVRFPDNPKFLSLTFKSAW